MLLDVLLPCIVLVIGEYFIEQYMLAVYFVPDYS